MTGPEPTVTTNAAEDSDHNDAASSELVHKGVTERPQVRGHCFRDLDLRALALSGPGDRCDTAEVAYKRKLICSDSDSEASSSGLLSY